MTEFNRIIDTLREHGWPGMSDQEAYQVLSDHDIKLSSLEECVLKYLAIASAEWALPLAA